MANIQAVRVADFVNSIGINTHIDFTSTAYGNLTTVENALNYIGVKNVRDSVNSTADVGTNGLWQQVANATGVKFDAYQPEGSPISDQHSLSYIQQMAPQHIFTSIEGGDEEDNTYAVANGNSITAAAQFQQQVYTVGQSLGLPVINISFGTGWSTNPTQGDYASVGNISSYSNYANAHVYYGTGNPPSSNIAMVNSLAQISAAHPVIITETGWYTTGSITDSNSVSDAVQAKYMLDGLMDAYQAGDAKTYLYELLDQKSGDGYSEDNFGVFQSNGTPKAAATALHNLTTLLADTGTASSSFTPGTLSYTLSGLQSTDHSMLMEKSDGTYWLSVWNETRLSSAITSTDLTVPNHTVTLNLGSTASSISVFDPLTGTTAVQSVNNAQTIQISLPDHPVLVEITPSTTGGTGGNTGGTTGGGTTSNDLSVTTPASATTTVNGTLAVTATINDAWAATAPGSMTLNLSTTAGTLTLADSSGNTVTGSGTNSVHVSGTLAQLNADLATLHFHAPSTTSTDTVSINVWNQAGVSTTQTTNVAVNAATTVASSNDLSIDPPTSISMVHGTTVQVSGVAVVDAWAASNPGSMSLNITDTSGTIAMTDSTGKIVTGSGTNAIHATGTLSQINAELATLSYHSSTVAGTDSISINVWNQAGVSNTQTIAVNNLLSGNMHAPSGEAIVSGSTGSTVAAGTGPDTFYYSLTNTGNGTTADHISNFSQANGDKIDLHGFGLTAANFNSTGALSGSKSFTFQDLTDSSGHPYTMVSIETNGGHTPTYEIQLDGVHLTMHATDFSFA